MPDEVVDRRRARRFGERERWLPGRGRHWLTSSSSANRLPVRPRPAAGDSGPFVVNPSPAISSLRRYAAEYSRWSGVQIAGILIRLDRGAAHRGDQQCGHRPDGLWDGATCPRRRSVPRCSSWRPPRGRRRRGVPLPSGSCPRPPAQSAASWRLLSASRRGQREVQVQQDRPQREEFGQEHLVDGTRRRGREQHLTDPGRERLPLARRVSVAYSSSVTLVLMDFVRRMGMCVVPRADDNPNAGT